MRVKSKGEGPKVYRGEATATRAAYAEVSRRASQSRRQSLTNQTNVVRLNTADTPLEPSSQRTRLNLLVAAFGGTLLGMGLAFYFGKPLIQPQAPQLPAIALGNWSDSPAVRSALQVNVLVPIGLCLALLMAWVFANTRIGLVLRMVGDSAAAARALGYPVAGVRVAATALGGMTAGLGGASPTFY